MTVFPKFKLKKIHPLIRIQELEQEVAKLTRRNKELETAASNQSWKDNPDRMGGSFTKDEITESNIWR